jgi:hypothetical protein
MLLLVCVAMLQYFRWQWQASTYRRGDFRTEHQTWVEKGDKGHISKEG